MSRSVRRAFGLVFCFAVTGVALGHSQKYHCKTVPLATETRWGGNELVEVDLRDKPVQRVRGVVNGPGEGTTSNLVQVYLRQPSDPLYQPHDRESRLPVAACVTGDDGRFDFSLPSGEYELRVSQNGGINVTSVFVIVKRRCHNSETIQVPMHVGT